MISIFIPAFNEEEILEKSLEALEKVVKEFTVNYEIFLIDDTSTDKTIFLSEKIARQNPRIRVINFTTGPSRRENLAASFKKASGDIVIFLDIDLISSLPYLHLLIGGVISGYDIVIGSRYMPGSKVVRKPFRLCTSLLYNFCIRIMFRGSLRDYLCGFKAFKRVVIIGLVEEMGFDKSFKRGIFWDTELLLRAARKGYSIKEIPIFWQDRNKTALSFRKEIKSLGYIYRFWRDFGKKLENSRISE